MRCLSLRKEALKRHDAENSGLPQPSPKTDRIASAIEERLVTKNHHITLHLSHNPANEIDSITRPHTPKFLLSHCSAAWQSCRFLDIISPLFSFTYLLLLHKGRKGDKRKLSRLLREEGIHWTSGA
jgi:hypothetical protein